MRLLRFFVCSVLALILACGPDSEKTNDLNPEAVKALTDIASAEGFNPYKGNPILTPGPEGSFDAGALGSVTLVKALGKLHLYYETWRVRSEKEWVAEEYETLSIGHAVSEDGLHWVKDTENPVIPQGVEGDFDETGVWDPFVLYEDGRFKMWYGGGGGHMPNFGWAYAESEDGTNFTKWGLIGIGNQTGCEDCHVVYDPDSGLYYMYYWHGWSEPDALFRVASKTVSGFNFNRRVKVSIKGDDTPMKKFAHVLKNGDGWHMFYSNFERAHCPNSAVRYATSSDGIHFTVRNEKLIEGHDADILKVADDLYVMVYTPQGSFDKKGCDIRLAVYRGRLQDLTVEPARNE